MNVRQRPTSTASVSSHQSTSTPSARQPKDHGSSHIAITAMPPLSRSKRCCLSFYMCIVMVIYFTLVVFGLDAFMMRYGFSWQGKLLGYFLKSIPFCIMYTMLCLWQAYRKRDYRAFRRLSTLPLLAALVIYAVVLYLYGPVWHPSQNHKFT